MSGIYKQWAVAGGEISFAPQPFGWIRTYLEARDIPRAFQIWERLTNAQLERGIAAYGQGVHHCKRVTDELARRGAIDLQFSSSGLVWVLTNAEHLYQESINPLPLPAVASARAVADAQRDAELRGEDAKPHQASLW